MQAQKQASYQMLQQVMGIFVNASHQGQPNSSVSQPWIPPPIPATTSGSWSIPVPATQPNSTGPQPMMPMPLHQPSSTENQQTSVSSTLQHVHSAQHYNNSQKKVEFILTVNELCF